MCLSYEVTLIHSNIGVDPCRLLNVVLSFSAIVGCLFSLSFAFSVGTLCFSPGFVVAPIAYKPSFLYGTSLLQRTYLVESVFFF